MNLYQLHKKPTEINHHDLSHNHVPKLAWKDYMPYGWYKERENLWAKDASSSYWYASSIINAPFPKGEDIISKSAEYSYWYARFVIKGPFTKGEDAIAKDAEHSYLYASNVLRTRFSKGEDMIAKDEYYKQLYEEDFEIKL